VKGIPSTSYVREAVLPLRGSSVPVRVYADQLKRVGDAVLAALLLAVCLPVILVAAFLICLDSPGSPIFRQRRIGKGGRVFEIWKLRTMHVGAEALGFRTDEADARVTRVGRLLRQTKLDELPQLWNVVRGDMSLIGPRPLSIEECDYLVREYGYSPSHAGFYPTVRPGLTGLEQIYRIHPLVYEDRFRWNEQYESSLSPWLDLKILLTTVLMCRVVSIAAILGGVMELAWLLWSASA
jgi:lipopolysaccharide/colanic/teichoic acid biosynthesis glycosyltransferase